MSKCQTPDNMDKIINIQEALLDKAYHLLNDNGLLVYATCTNNKKENEYQVNKLLNKYNDIKLEEEINIYNYQYDSDGFYIAKIIKI